VRLQQHQLRPEADRSPGYTDSLTKEEQVTEAALSGEIVEEHSAQIVPMPAPQTQGALSLFGDTPAEALERVNELAGALGKEIESNGWIATLTFGGRESRHVTIEGWQFAGALVGVFGVVVKTERIKIDGVSGWEAHAEARTIGGQIVGAGDGMCMKNESRWGSVDEYARRSMAQTRALARALSGPLRFAVQKAGFDGTPYEDAEGAARSRSGPRTANGGDTKRRPSGSSGKGGPSPAQLKMAADKLLEAAARGLTDSNGEILTADRILRDACAKWGVEFTGPEESESWVGDTLSRFTGGGGGQISQFIDRMKAALV
jgi:hypothetical protein